MVTVCIAPGRLRVRSVGGLDAVASLSRRDAARKRPGATRRAAFTRPWDVVRRRSRCVPASRRGAILAQGLVKAVQTVTITQTGS